MGSKARFVMVNLLAIVLLAGCATVGPDFKPPTASMEQQWKEKDPAALSDEPNDLDRWWELLGDPVLTRLISQARTGNLSLQAAGLRILEARARLAVVTGSLYPQQQNINGGVNAFGLSKNAANTDYISRNFQIYQLGFDAAWEIDFWGRFRRGIEAAGASVMATIAGYDDLLVSLQAEVAKTYVLLRTFQRRLDVARQNVAIMQRSLQIAEARFKSGAVSELDVQQAKAILAETKAMIPKLETGVRQSQNSLSILLGLAPGQIDQGVLEPAPIPQVPEKVAVGIPADLLRRRPDIRRAELQAAAQCAKIGVAKAELLPAFSLTGSIGLASLQDGSNGQDLGDFFDGDSLAWRAGFGFRWPILNYGRIKNKVRVQDARFQRALVNYRNAVLKAARETEDAMVAFAKSLHRLRFLSQSADSYTRSLQIATIQYREGLVDYQRVLDIQRYLTRQQDALAAAQGEVVINLIALYKALGGGWQTRETLEVVNAENRRQMNERTDWGGLLDDTKVEPSASPREYRWTRKVHW